MPKHETLQNIKLEFEDNHMIFNIILFKKLVKFCHAKPNTKIEIKIRKEYDVDQFNNY